MEKSDPSPPSSIVNLTRKLAAILSADVQGYSRLMGENEVTHQWDHNPQALGKTFELLPVVYAGTRYVEGGERFINSRLQLAA